MNDETLGAKLAYVDLAQQAAGYTKATALAAEVLRDAIRNRHPSGQTAHPMEAEVLRMCEQGMEHAP